MKSLFGLMVFFIMQHAAANINVKYHPGHYATLQNNFTQSDLQEILKTPGLTGVQLRYTWIGIETSEGIYDFSKIGSDLEIVSKANKYLIVFFEDKSFKNGVRYTPEYLWEEYTLPSNQSQNGEKGFISKRYDNYVVERISALMEAMAKKFDNEPCFEGVAFQETSIGLNDSNKIKYNYTPEKYRDALIMILTNAKSSFINSQVFWFMNFLADNQSYIGEIANAIIPFKILMGGPDILPNSSSLNNLVYPYYIEFKDQLNLFCAAQFDSYHHLHSDGVYDTKFWTMEEIFLWGRDHLFINYCFWNVPKTPAEPGAYTWEDAKPVILKYQDFKTTVLNTVNEKFKIIPNPGKGLYTVISKSTNQFHEISVFDFNGKLVHKELFSDAVVQIDLRKLTSNVYLIKVDHTAFKVIKL